MSHFRNTFSGKVKDIPEKQQIQSIWLLINPCIRQQILMVLSLQIQETASQSLDEILAPKANCHTFGKYS